MRIIWDFLVVGIAVIGAFRLSPSFTEGVFVAGSINPLVMPVVLGMGATVSLSNHLLNEGYPFFRIARIEVVARALIGSLVGAVVFAILYSLSTNVLFGRYVLAISVALAWVGTSGVHLFVNRLRQKEVYRFGFVGDKAEKLTLRELIGDLAENVSIVPLERRQVAGVDLICNLRENEAARDVVVGESYLGDSQRAGTVMALAIEGINVIDINCFCEKYLRHVYVPTVDERWIMRFDAQYLHPVFQIFKRALDLLLSVIGLFVALPLAVLVAAALKLQDGGPVFYSQVRTGLRGKPFRIFKFRTMRVDAEKAGPQWASRGDARVTWLGNLLRKTRIDEVPQFWNILRGEMSFIGPRPERPEMVKIIQEQIPAFACRTLIKPGLTGWAQINYPYGASIKDAERKLGYDLYYIKHASVLLDLVILLRTSVAMVKGAR